MVIAEISLAIGAVKAVGQAIDGAKSIVEIANQLDKCFSLADQVKHTKPKGKTSARIEQKLNKFDNSTGESTEFSDIVQEVTDAKALQFEMFRLKTKLNLKWGPDTWDTIINTRNERLRKAKEIREEHIEEMREIKKIHKQLFFEALKAIGLIFIITGFGWWLMQNY